jgi:hypothetical protein
MWWFVSATRQSGGAQDVPVRDYVDAGSQHLPKPHGSELLSRKHRLVERKFNRFKNIVKAAR